MAPLCDIVPEWKKAVDVCFNPKLAGRRASLSWRQRHRQREKKQAPCRELSVGLDPRTPESHPEPKADAQPLSHQASQSLRPLEKSPENGFGLLRRAEGLGVLCSPWLA